jgi:hypothetical protein
VKKNMNYSCYRLHYRPRILLATAAVAVAFALSGCGGGDDQPGVATAAASGQPAASASAGSGPVAAYVEAQRQWVKCLRDQGFDVPDPDAKGQVAFGNNRELKADPKWITAQETCSKFNIPVPAELEETEPPRTKEQIAHLREYAKCLRANGVPDHPDPDANGNWGTWAGANDEVALSRASQICDPVLDGRAPTTPGPVRTGQG